MAGRESLKRNAQLKDGIVDAHLHLFEVGRYEYAWYDWPEFQPLKKRFMPDEVKPILQEIGVKKVVLVQTLHSLDETYWFLELADKYDFIAGVVGWVDLTAPDCTDVLDDLVQYPKFKGVRHQVEGEADERWLVRPEVIAAFKELAARGLEYDLLVRMKHLDLIPQVTERVPDLRMVIDHIAKPPIASGELEPWASGMKTAARIPNVYCKLSGMITEADWKNWKPADLKPYIDVVIENFGFDRVMFGSDWPVCNLAGSYKQVVDALNENIKGISASERTRLFSENAIRFYHLD